MRIWIRILDPHWKKMDPIPGYFHKNWNILTKQNFQIVFLIFFAYFYA